MLPSGAIDEQRDFRAICADEARFRPWFDDAVGRVYSYLLPRCAGDHALTEELTHGAIIKALKARDQYDGSSPIIAWVRGIARNLLIDHHRRRAREEQQWLRLVVTEVEAGPAQLLADRDAVLDTLRRLPALQRGALILRYMEDMSVAEVAHRLGKSEPATVSLLARARGAFRRRYGEEP